MPRRFNDHKRRLQFSFAIERQNASKLVMHGDLCRWRDSKIEHPPTHAVKKHQGAKVAVARDENSVLFACNAQ